ncbi:hypothetical protein JNJ66_00470 [Candidatus Saccharibacteria bacterium]|nr:hypothetical protein [Candidatus Saccharibacteria bacterium]
MINLLPPEVKREFRAGRVNTLLIKYLITMAVAAVAIMAVFGVSLILNERNKADYTLLRQDSEKQLGKLNEIKAQVQQFNANVDRVKGIYSKELILSNAVVSISKALPPGAIIGTISLDAAQIDKPLSLTIQTDSFNKGAIVKENFEISGVFKDIKLGGITGDPRTSTGQYPYTVNITATLKPEALKSQAATPPEGGAQP